MRLLQIVFRALAPVCMLATLASVSWGDPAFDDPLGDVFGVPNVAHDIARINSQVSPSTLTFVVDFHGAIAPPSSFARESVVGFIDIDVDQDPLTGTVSNKSRFSPHGDSGLGIEFYIDLFSERFHPGAVEVVDTSTMQPVGMAAAIFDTNRFSVEVPLGLLGGDSLLNYGVIVGDFLNMSDEAPNDGVAGTIPEPSGLWLAVAIGVLGVLCGRRPPSAGQRNLVAGR